MSAPGSEFDPPEALPRGPIRLAALVLAHEHPDLVARLIGRLAEACETIVLHWDAKSDQAALDRELARLPEAVRGRVLASPRIAVEWGDWSVVEATLGAIGTLIDSGRAFDFALLLSGSDYPIRSAAELRAFLTAHPMSEFIEAVDPLRKRWVAGGLNQERYRYHHPFNWRTRPLLHHQAWTWQKRLGLVRGLPRGLQPALGSQWWALTAATLAWVHERARDRALQRFFRTVWIPDEMFIQTLVRSSPASARIAGRTLTHVQFTVRGKPTTLHDDHADYLRRQPFFFARKLAPEAMRLRDILDQAQAEPDPRSVAAAPGLRDRFPTAERAVFLELFADGLEGRRVPGRVQDAWYGDLEWNTRPYLVLIDSNEERLALAARSLASRPGWQVFGSLFDPRRIDYGPSTLRLPGYGAFDVPMRDDAPQTFLVQLLGAAPPGNVCFTLNLRNRVLMTDVMLWDRNASLAVLDHLPDNRPKASADAEHELLRFPLAGIADRAGSLLLDSYLVELRQMAKKRNLTIEEVPMPAWLTSAGHPASAASPADPLLGRRRILTFKAPAVAVGGTQANVAPDWVDAWHATSTQPGRQPVWPLRPSAVARNDD